ncbi:MAG: tRNA lysidine(34) synthetase TilS [Oscillospiraceae bacterium]|nr:tRNA lysidine(34) synthetase TilS [Oscillospiraceae bacterium]
MKGRKELTDIILESPACPVHCICTVAFSGGADSTALLLALYELREQLQIDLRAVHVHHGIRGEEADRDAAFCREFCQQRQISFRLEYVDVPAYAKEHRLSEETAARILRYQKLHLAGDDGLIATAHHAGDNAETVLFHLMRGSGLKGLRGILPCSGNLIRPMLYAEKAEILAFLEGRGQTFQEDSTNLDSVHSRNRIRQELIPLMLRENPAFLSHIMYTTQMLSEDHALLEQQAEEALRHCLDVRKGGMRGLEQYPKPIRMRIYMNRLAALPVHIDPSRENLYAIDQLLAAQNGKISLGSRIYATAWHGILYIRQESAPLQQVIPAQIGENHVFEGDVCKIVAEERILSQNYHASYTRSTLDFDKINGNLYFRQWNGKDRIQLPGRSFESALKDCIQAAVPAPERRLQHVLYDNSGCVYCENVGVAARVKPDAETQRVLVVQYPKQN